MSTQIGHLLQFQSLWCFSICSLVLKLTLCVVYMRLCVKVMQCFEMGRVDFQVLTRGITNAVVIP